jgi:PAS domain S-box-containing protein
MSRSGYGGGQIAFGAPEEVLEAALDAIITIDADGLALYVNRAAERMFAVDRDEVLGKLIGEIVLAPQELEAHCGKLAPLLDQRCEVTGQRSDGAQFPMELTVTVSSESPRQYTGFIRDLSVQKEDERQRQRMRALLDRAEQVVGMGSYQLSFATREMVWSDELFRMLGLEPGEVEPTLEVGLERVPADGQEEIREAIAQVFETKRPVVGEFRIELDDGTVRYVCSDGMVELDDDGEPVALVGTVRDVTAERMLERDLRAHHALTKALNDWDTFDEGVTDLLRRLGMAMDWDMGSLWVRSPGRADVLVSRAFWANPESNLASFEDRSKEMVFERGVGAVWKVWHEQRPHNVVDLTSDEAVTKSPARSEAIDIGVRSAILFPAIDGRETLAVLSFAGREPRALTDGLLNTLESLGHDLGRFLAKRRSEIGLQRLSDRELQVLRLAADGLSAPMIAERLVIGTATVKTHFTHIYEKLGVADRPAAVAEAMRQGLIE